MSSNTLTVPNISENGGVNATIGTGGVTTHTVEGKEIIIDPTTNLNIGQYASNISMGTINKLESANAPYFFGSNSGLASGILIFNTLPNSNLTISGTPNGTTVFGYNTTDGKFFPGVLGKYLVVLHGLTAIGLTAEIGIAKNGNALSGSFHRGVTSNFSYMGCSIIVSITETTDYISGNVLFGTTHISNRQGISIIKIPNS